MSVPLKWVAVAHLGIMGIPIVGALAYTAFVWPGAIAGYRRALVRVAREHADAAEHAEGESREG